MMHLSKFTSPYLKIAPVLLSSPVELTNIIVDILNAQLTYLLSSFKLEISHVLVSWKYLEDMTLSNNEGGILRQ